MDQQTAFKILNLDSTASFDDAKKAYRQLAKAYHPDIVGIKSGIFDDRRMKEINLAFYYLTPTLRAKKVKAEAPAENNKTKKDTTKAAPAENQNQTYKSDKVGFYFSNLFGKISAYIKSVAQKKAKTENQQRAHRKQSCRSIKKPFPGKKNFDQVLSRVYDGTCPQPTGNIGKSQNIRFSKKTRPYQGYQTYLELKKKMTATKKRRNADVCISPVEKIQPVQRVNPVQKDSN